jgi:hypothetical protein
MLLPLLSSLSKLRFVGRSKEGLESMDHKLRSPDPCKRISPSTLRLCRLLVKQLMAVMDLWLAVHPAARKNRTRNPRDDGHAHPQSSIITTALRAWMRAYINTSQETTATIIINATALLYYL